MKGLFARPMRPNGGRGNADGMTADFFPCDMSFLARTPTGVINEVKGVNRVVYDMTSKPPGTFRVGVTSPLASGARICRRASVFKALGANFVTGANSRARNCTKQNAAVARLNLIKRLRERRPSEIFPPALLPGNLPRLPNFCNFRGTPTKRPGGSTGRRAKFLGSPARIPYVGGRRFRGHTISGRGSNLFNPLRRHFVTGANSRAGAREEKFQKAGARASA